ncbi:MAG TPA: transposase [Verrucomicrobiota bacterium]|nr:transposase [Verrucomicrobiota bacterium]
MTKTQRKTTRSHPHARPSRSYTPVSDALSQPLTFADTELAEGLQRHSLVALLHAAIGRQRRCDGEPLANVLCALLVWPLLKVKSLHCFCAELCQILAGQVSVLYDFLGREDINWRGLTSELARRVDRANDLGARSQRAFVVDDTSQARAGRKVEGTSCYFDHTEGRHRKGHLVLQLGLASEHGFLPLEAQIVTGKKGAIDKPKDKPFADQRSSAARDMRRAREHSKPQLFRQMLQRALRAGFAAAYVLADAWFGCKENIACCLENKLTALFQMKRGLLAYRYHGHDYTAHQLYGRVQRRMQPAHRRARFKTASLGVRLNLETHPRQPARWVEVRLVFSAPVRATSANTWVVFLCTNTKLSDTKILEVYSLRWSIEVYFKEIKQHLGFLKEQSGRYQVAYASVHLAALRYLLLFEAMLRAGQLSYGEIRDRESGQLQALTYAALLWQLLRAMIEGALQALVRDLGRKLVKKVLVAIDQSIEGFLNQALQITPQQIEVQLRAEELGYV